MSDNKKVDSGAWVFLTVFICIMVGVGCLMAGVAIGEDNARTEAVRKGAAYYTNDVNGSSQFKWITER